MKYLILLLAFPVYADHGYQLKLFGDGMTSTTVIDQMETKRENFELCRDLRREFLQDPRWQYVLCTPEI